MTKRVLYQYPNSVRGFLLRRYKRFLADISLEGDHKGSDGSSADVNPRIEAVLEEEHVTIFPDTGERGFVAQTCHCPNTGPMTGLLDRPSAPVLLSVHDGTKRKYRHTLEMIQPEPGGAWVGVHSAIANKLVSALLEDHAVPGLPPYKTHKAEVTSAHIEGGDAKLPQLTVSESHVTSGPLKTPISPQRLQQKRGQLAKALSKSQGKRARAARAGPASRVDFLLVNEAGQLIFVEVKSVTLAEPGPAGDGKIALFPDTVSERAQRHMEDLTQLAAKGHKAACIFMIQRDDCAAFAPCYEKDPEYARLVIQAAEQGVTMIALACCLDPDLGTISFLGEVPVLLTHGQPS